MFRLICVALLGLALVPERVLRPGHVQSTETTPPFCTRNPHTCGAVGEIWDGLRHKLQLASGLVFENLAGDAPMFGLIPSRAEDQLFGSDREPGTDHDGRALNGTGQQFRRPNGREPGDASDQPTTARQGSGTLQNTDLLPSWRGETRP